MSQTLQTTYAAKRKARRFAVQGIYEWQMSHNPVHEIEARTGVENAMHKVDLGYYHELLTQVVANHEALDALLVPVLDRDIQALDGVELATLRLGAYELEQHLEFHTVWYWMKRLNWQNTLVVQTATNTSMVY